MPYKVKVPTPIGNLEAQIFIPEQNIKNIGIVLCHPHPQYGGTMANPVIRTLFKALVSQGNAVIRFNFRGVQESAGEFGNGIGEKDDLKEIITYLLEKSDVSSVWIIGYSFGAAIGLAKINNPELNRRIKGYVAISYPFTFIPDFINDIEADKPKFFIMGDQDDFTSLPNFENTLKTIPEPKESYIFKGINHFWIGNEQELTKKIINFVSLH